MKLQTNEIEQEMADSHRYLDLSDLSRLITLSDPQISPDGNKVIFLHTKPNFAENQYENTLMLLEIATGVRRPLTYHRSQVSSPRWSPSGDLVAFLAAGNSEGNQKRQLYILFMSGGEAQCITDLPQGVDLFVWRPDGEALAIVTEDEPEERTEEEIHNRSFEVGDHNYLATSAPLPAHIWLVPINGEPIRRLTTGNAGVMRFAMNSREPIAWSPDGERLIFASQPRPHSGEIARGSLKMLEIATEHVETIVPGPTHPTCPCFSPDGQWLAYARPPQGLRPAWNPHDIYVVPTEALVSASTATPISSDDERCVTAAIDRTFYEAQWHPESNAILVDGYDHTRTALWFQPLAGEARQLDLGTVLPTNGTVTVSRNGGIVLIGREPQRPDELYYLSSVDAQPQRLTDYNNTIASLHLGEVTSITWQGPDGFAEDGVVIFPPDFVPSKQYPVVLMLHGGPMGATTEVFNLIGQLMAARGWIMFSPNYRGSTNLGRAYHTAVIQDAGDGPGRDVMAGLAALKARGFVDESRIAVSGWSYGGYMTTWLIGHYGGWAAAVAGAAVTDYMDSYYLSDLNVVFGGGFHDSPSTQTGAQIWREQSPITYAERIQTPTLLLSNTGDLRVPITQSYKFYHILKEQGVKVKFVAYPLAGHSPGDPVHQRDVYRRWLNWIEEHF